MERNPTWHQGPGLIDSVWRYRWLIAAAAVVGGVLGFVLSLVQPTVYEADARLVLRDPRTSSVFQDQSRAATDPERHLAKEAERITSRVVLEVAAESLEPSMSVPELRGSLSTEEHPLVDALVVIASAPTAQRAADIANAVGTAYQGVVREEVQASAQAAIEELNEARAQASAHLDTLRDSLDENPDDTSLQAEFEVAREQLTTISARAQQLAVEAAVYDAGVETFEPADAPLERSQPKPLRTTVVGMVLAMFAAGAFGWWRAEHNQVAEDSAQVVGLLGAPLLGDVPVFRPQRGNDTERPLLGTLDPWSTEAYQFVVASLHFALQGVKGTSVAVTSVAQGDGKTVTAMNIAFMAAQDGRKVVLLDGDERVRGLTMSFGLENRAGLSDIVVGGAPLSACSETQTLPDASGPVQVIPAGRRMGEVAGFFRRPEFRIAMDMLRDESDLLVVDTPPLLAVSDVLQIAGHADGVVVVVSRGTPLKLLREARSRLAMVGTPILGFVFNRAKGRQRASPYYAANPGSYRPSGGGDLPPAGGYSNNTAPQASAAEPEHAGPQLTHRFATGTAASVPAVEAPARASAGDAVAVPPPGPAQPAKGCPSPEEAALASCDGMGRPRIVAVEKYGDEARVLVDGVPSRFMVVPCERRDGLWYGMTPYPLVS